MSVDNKRFFVTKTLNTHQHDFTRKIAHILERMYGDDAKYILENSPLLGYINIKTKAANRDSKARSSYGNLYALYVIVEDYISNGFANDPPHSLYDEYEGAQFSELFRRQRELPFGSKLQNHALNSRLNDEFKKYYPSINIQPIVRDVTKRRYWVSESLLIVDIPRTNNNSLVFNIARAVIAIIDSYIQVKRANFEHFISTCQAMLQNSDDDLEGAHQFIMQQLKPDVDARVFEIVSYAILKVKYSNETVWLGNTLSTIAEQQLTLYKTGRTNANDGGIDFILKPLGRFFQVTETVDVKKYFLDIDKIQRFPITFVVKSNDSRDVILESIRRQAILLYGSSSTISSYLMAIEEIINVPDLGQFLSDLAFLGKLRAVLEEMIIQSKVEFNYRDDNDCIS